MILGCPAHQSSLSIIKGKLYKVYFRYYRYSVVSLPSSVIYFGGSSTDLVITDGVAEYKNFRWKLLGNLSSPRNRHSSINIETTIYIFGGYDDDFNDVK